MNTFADRATAGRALAQLVPEFVGRTDAVVLGLARGGVPVAAELAKAADLPVGVAVVRRLRVPTQRSLSLGVMGSDGAIWLDVELITRLGISDRLINDVIRKESAELRRRLVKYPKTGMDVANRSVILVDDGITVGGRIRAAIRAVRSREAKEIVVVVPVAAASAASLIGQAEDVTIRALCSVSEPVTIREFYRDFAPTTDDEIVAVVP